MGNAAPPGFRCFEHADGRQWQVRAHGADIELRIDTGDGDWVERKRTLDDSDAAKAEEATLARQQVADGFREISVPRWLAFLEQLVEFWKLDDPRFDAPPLKVCCSDSNTPTTTGS